jgi:uncharacterized protein (DUF1810 family)
MSDPFQLSRFVTAQEGVYEAALREIREGRKSSHWMWFVFPQLDGLGRSPMAQQYAIKSLAEARAFLEHPLLGPRLHACVRALLEVKGRSAAHIFGSPDDLKLRSSLTLFARATGTPSVFEDALAAYFDGVPDARTLALLEERERGGA